MHFYCIGLDYKSAPIEAREELVRERPRLEAFCRMLSAGAHEVIFTCNRIEVYGLGPQARHVYEALGLLRRQFPHFARYGYMMTGKTAISLHAVRLATGLESQIKGEAQIIRQLSDWIQGKGFSDELRIFWEDVLKEAVRIRAQSGLDREHYSVADAVFEDVHDAGVDLSESHAVIIGTGKIARLLSRHTRRLKKATFTAHKNFSVARELAKAGNAEAVLLDELPRLLKSADILISATASPHCILKAADLSVAIPARRHTLHIYDVAMPRDIEPCAAGLEGLTLKHVDSLGVRYAGHERNIRDKIQLAGYLAEEAARCISGGFDGNDTIRDTAESLGA